MPTRTLFEVDHIIPVSRWQEFLNGRLAVQPAEGSRELNHLDNFAWSCPYCNLAKGNQVSGRVSRHSVRLFDPRRDFWSDHFVMTGGHVLIKGLTDVGKATESVLAFNSPRLNGPLVARHKAIVDGIYPPDWARASGF